MPTNDLLLPGQKRPLGCRKAAGRGWWQRIPIETDGYRNPWFREHFIMRRAGRGMVLRGFDKEIGRIGKTCRCVMGKRALQEKEGCLPQRQVCGFPAGGTGFPVDKCRSQAIPTCRNEERSCADAPARGPFLYGGSTCHGAFPLSGHCQRRGRCGIAGSKDQSLSGKPFESAAPGCAGLLAGTSASNGETQKPRRPSYHRIRGLPKKAVKRIAAEMAGPKGIRLFRIPAEKRRPRTQDRIRQSSPPTGPR